MRVQSAFSRTANISRDGERLPQHSEYDDDCANEYEPEKEASHGLLIMSESATKDNPWRGDTPEEERRLGADQEE